MKCEICKDEWPDRDGGAERFLDHLRVMHPEHYEEPERWPDGTPVIYDETLEPGDFGTDDATYRQRFHTMPQYNVTDWIFLTLGVLSVMWFAVGGGWPYLIAGALLLAVEILPLGLVRYRIYADKRDGVIS